MKLFGIELRKATFNEITAAAVLGTGLWMVGLGFAQASGHALDIREAGALLLVTAWACIAVRIGLGIDQGRRHLLVNIGVIATVARRLRRRPGFRRLTLLVGRGRQRVTLLPLGSGDGAAYPTAHDFGVRPKRRSDCEFLDGSRAGSLFNATGNKGRAS